MTDQDIQDELARIAHILRQAAKDAQNWERQSNDWEERWRQVTKERDDAQSEWNANCLNWTAELEAKDARIAELERTAAAVIDKISQDDNNVTPDTVAALHALLHCVSSNGAEHGKTQSEDTRA